MPATSLDKGEPMTNEEIKIGDLVEWKGETALVVAWQRRDDLFCSLPRAAYRPDTHMLLWMTGEDAGDFAVGIIPEFMKVSR